MEVWKYKNEDRGTYNITIKTNADDSIGVNTFSFPSGSTEIGLVGIKSGQIAELVYRLEEVYQEIVMQEELHLDKLQSGIMEAKQVQAEVANDK